MTIFKASNNQNTESWVFLFCFSKDNIHSHTSVQNPRSFAYLVTAISNFRTSSKVTLPSSLL